MTAEGNAVEDRLGETTDHATNPVRPMNESREGQFLYATGARPLAGYTIKRGVGAGGFGEVYYAVSDAGKDVALKLIRRNLDTELRGIRQCLNLKHPNLLSLYDIRVDDSGDTWIVMEFVAGESLEAVLADHPQGLPVDEALAWIRGIAGGVAYLHDHGIVHRDLKPGNIFSDEGIVKVGDYGLSKFISCSRRSGHTESIGTVHYMAPEVAHGRYGKELDIYALGAVLFELLTGRVPFDGESVGEVLMKHLTAQPDVSRLAEPYRSVVARALDKDPAKRFATVGEMLAALECGAGTQRAGSSPPFSTSRHSNTREASNQTDSLDFSEKAAASCRTPNLEDTNEEPIARAVRQALADLRRDWGTSKLRAKIESRYYVKVLLIFCGIGVLLAFGHIWIPLAMFLTVLYVGYRMVRGMYLLLFAPRQTRPRMRRTAPTPRQEAVSPSAGPPPAAVVVVVKPLPVRVRELIGSLLVAAAVTAAMCVVMALILAYNNKTTAQPEQCAWLFLVSLAGAWTVLITGKAWEGNDGEPMLRRFILMTLGLGIGLLAAAADDAFFVHLLPDAGLSTRTGLRLPAEFYQDGRPQVMAYMAVFATLLGLVPLLCWWRQGNPLRTTRLSLMSLVLTVLGAHVVAYVWQFPEPWLMMVAGCMSVAVQLASPWVPTYARLKPQRKKVI